MKIKISISFILSFLILQLSGCKEKKTEERSPGKVLPVIVSDTIIGSKPITDEIAGSAYRKRAKSYFIIVKNDTSAFQPVFDESKEGGKMGLDLDLPYESRNITYRQILQELQLVLPAAMKDFNPDSLNSISYGRLILSGDLAIKITEEFKNEFGLPSRIKPQDYKQVSDFLKTSTLAEDVNKIWQ